MEISCCRLSKTFQIRRSVISIIITRRLNVWRGSQRHRTLVVSIRGIPKIRSSFREIEQPTSHFASRHGLKFNSSNDWLIPLPAIRIFYDVGRREDHPPREIGDPLDPRKSQRVIILISSPFISINPSCPLDESIHQQPNSRGNGSSGLPMNIPLNEDRRVPMAPFEAHTYSSGVLAASSTESRPVFLWWKCLSHVASLSLSLSLSFPISSRPVASFPPKHRDGVQPEAGKKNQRQFSLCCERVLSFFSATGVRKIRTRRFTRVADV